MFPFRDNTLLSNFLLISIVEVVSTVMAAEAGLKLLIIVLLAINLPSECDGRV